LNQTADLKDKISPCRFAGTPDCSQCGRIASAGLVAVGEYRLFNLMPLRTIYNLSERVGRAFSKAN
jgi:hypothetical protein